MSEGEPGNILAFKPGMEISAVRPTISAEEILYQEASIPRIELSIDEIQMKMLDATGNIMPDELIDQMGFSSLRWQLLKKHNGLAGIFLGAAKDSSGPIGLQDALGVVETRSRTDLVSKAEFRNFLAPQKIVPDSIRISGTVMDNLGTVRAVGCLYRALDFSSYKPASLYGADISVSESELPSVPDTIFDDDVWDQYIRSSHSIPSSVNKGFYKTAALITSTEVAQTDHHNRTLRLLGTEGTLHLGFSQYSYYSDDYPNPGFLLNKRNDHQTLTFDPKDRGKSRNNVTFNTPSNLPTWEISLPAQLEK